MHKHRHCVGLPLFIALLILSSIPAMGGFMGGGSDDRVEIPFLEEGTHLLSGDGMVPLHIRSMTLTGMHGAYTATLRGNALSVAALTSPVFMQDGELRMIVPVGWQWQRTEEDVTRLRSLLPIPLAFHREQIARLPRHIPSSQQTQEDLSSSPAFPILPAFLAAARDDPRRLATLLPLLLAREEGWILASFHPAFRDAAWVLGEGKFSPASDALRHLVLPLADLLPEALSPLAVARWEEGVQGEIAALEDPLPFLEELIRTVALVVDRAAQHGYYERAQRYARILERLADPFTDDLSAGAMSDLAALPGKLHPSFPPTLIATLSATSSSASTAPVTFSPVEVQEKVTQELREQKMMFSRDTVVEALSPTSARVQAVVLATPRGDELFDFTYDTERQEVSDIIRGSTRYPYAVSLAGFLQWVRGGNDTFSDQ